MDKEELIIDFSDNPEFKNAYDLVRYTNESFFLTGKAGTGKSTFLKYILKHVHKSFVVVAPTGIAAVNVGGTTIHSFFQLPLRPLIPEDDGIKIFSNSSEKRKVFEAMDTLIIDEVSMVRADILDAIDYSLKRNGGRSDLPFGGKQVILVGDVFQLEPVTTKKRSEEDIYRQFYSSPYFFSARVFKAADLLTIELQKVYRQSDPVFIELLDKIRANTLTAQDVERINSRLSSAKRIEEQDKIITLTSTNLLAEALNVRKINELPGRPKTYMALIEGEFEESKYPTDFELKLKVGAQVVFIKNDAERRWVNGTLATVVEANNQGVMVEIEDGSIYKVEPRTWENIVYSFNNKTRKIVETVVGTFTQYPLKLAWAITIHKSQGLTFEKMVLDFGSGTFASGQAYVAFSRARTFNGIFLKTKVNRGDIILSTEVENFAKTFNNVEKIQARLEATRSDLEEEEPVSEDSRPNKTPYVPNSSSSGISILQPEMYELLSLLCSKFELSSLDGDVLKLDQGIVVPDAARFQRRLWALIEQVELLQLPNQKDGVFSKNGIDIEWVDIPAGTFMMGSPENEVERYDDEGPQHQVFLSGFKMSKVAVTFAQYDAFCQATGRSKPSDYGWGRGKRPVIDVDWNDATAFAQWMGCRLPTEAEWEYACRAGTSTPFNTGDCLSTAQANYDGNYPYSNCIKGAYLERTQPVGSYAPNAWGLYDMHGNVWEWCSDWYGSYSSFPQTNPTGPASGSYRVLRGGSWIYSGRYCRSANRNYFLAPSNRHFNSGFRLVVPS
jgi:formylglycine-generating enzyme required for sulfatase activity